MTNIQTQHTDFCRAGLANAVDMITTTVEGAQRLRTHQLAIIGQILTENAKLGAQINDSKSLDDLMTVCATLAGTQFKIISGYWRGVHQVATENQVACYERGQVQITEMQRRFAKSLEASVDGGPEPVVQAVNATVSAISSGFNTVARAAAETAKLAAAQVATAEAGIRPAATTRHKTV
jgi:phasin protein